MRAPAQIEPRPPATGGSRSEPSSPSSTLDPTAISDGIETGAETETGTGTGTGTRLGSAALRPPRLTRVLAIVWLLVAGWSALAVPARAESGARVTADEPQYLLTAISLGEDRNLNIADELRSGRWLAFHEASLPQQTRPLANGRRVSPHDPLLPLLLVGPVALGGWIGAKLAMAMLAGALAAALVWVAVRRFGVPVRVAAAVTVAFALVPPLSVYGTQIYPELPAALAVTGIIGALTGLRRRRSVAFAAVLLGLLPWLSIKYTPVVVAVGLWTAIALLRDRRVRAALLLSGIVAISALAFVLVHRAFYGGWTAYAAGDQFTAGELTVAGAEPELATRSVRLVGLLTDARFGLLAWAPAFLLVVPAFAALARRRPAGWSLLAVILGSAWLNATFVALTMHGWWWPGRQVVAAAPAMVLAVVWFVAHARPARAWSGALIVATVVGVFTWGWLLTEVLTGQRQLIIDFDQTTSPWYRLWRTALPDGQIWEARDQWLTYAWIAALVGLAWLGWQSVAPRLGPPGPPITDGQPGAPFDPVTRTDHSPVPSSTSEVQPCSLRPTAPPTGRVAPSATVG